MSSKSFLLVISLVALFQLNNAFMEYFNQQMEVFNKQMNHMNANLAQSMQKLNTDMKILDEDMKYLRSLTYNELSVSYKEPSSSRTHYNFGGCDCNGVYCTCCALTEIDKLNMTKPLCFEINYLGNNELNILAKQALLQVQLPFEKKVSVFELNDACDGSNTFCIHFYNTVLSDNKGTLNGCADMIFKRLDVQIERLRLGCFLMSTGGKSYQRSIVSVHMENSSAFYLNQLNPQYSENINLPKLWIVNLLSLSNGESTINLNNAKGITIFG